VVLGYSTMMRDAAPDEATRQRAIKVLAAAERCARIVKTFLTMARRTPEAWAPVRINQIIESALDVVGYGLRGADIAVDLDLAPDLPAVAGDADQLNLVLMNLIVNAQHALQGDRRRAVSRSSPDTGGMVQLEVADNGGHRGRNRQRIFRRFSAKPRGGGTGKPMVCQVITAHDGEIGVGSRPTGGALFMITLPSTSREPAPSVVAESPAPIAGRVLVVDDELEIAQMVREVLNRDHHQVAVATSGREALERLAEHPVDLILAICACPTSTADIASSPARRPDLAGGWCSSRVTCSPDTARFLAETVCR
jgi:hypothetical protein